MRFLKKLSERIDKRKDNKLTGHQNGKERLNKSAPREIRSRRISRSLMLTGYIERWIDRVHPRIYTLDEIRTWYFIRFIYFFFTSLLSFYFPPLRINFYSFKSPASIRLRVKIWRVPRFSFDSLR